MLFKKRPNSPIVINLVNKLNTLVTQVRSANAKLDALKSDNVKIMNSIHLSSSDARIFYGCVNMNGHGDKFDVTITMDEPWTHCDVTVDLTDENGSSDNFANGGTFLKNEKNIEGGYVDNQKVVYETTFTIDKSSCKDKNGNFITPTTFSFNFITTSSPWSDKYIKTHSVG